MNFGINETAKGRTVLKVFGNVRQNAKTAADTLGIGMREAANPARTHGLGFTGDDCTNPIASNPRGTANDDSFGMERRNAIVW